MCEFDDGDGDSYLRIKLQPLVKNGIASFYEERIRIPYSSEIALVFKMFRAKKDFGGHCKILKSRSTCKRKVMRWSWRKNWKRVMPGLTFKLRLLTSNCSVMRKVMILRMRICFLLLEAITHSSRSQRQTIAITSQIRLPHSIRNNKKTVITSSPSPP